jgi:putative hydrolase of the HAD superfamily
MIDNSNKTLVFDWGNTLMIDLPHKQGRMVDWPEVAAIEGAPETLKKLHQTFQIVVATNAENSNAEDVKAAFRRVNLDSEIDQVFTYHELKARKPDHSFYENISRLLDSKPENLVMIGDSYLNDILPAWQSGWHTIWFNPCNTLAAGHLPVQGAECYGLSEIPHLLSANGLPSLQTCISWYMNQGATYTLIAHVTAVAAIAYQMAVWLKDKGFKVSPLLTHRGGFLHDISKLREKENSNHAVEAYQFLLDRQQPELAKIARYHLIGDLKSADYCPKTWEQKIVNYADKLTEGNQIVILQERLNALQQRYPNFADKIRSNTPYIQNLENEIVTALEITPIKLLDDLKNALFNG